MKLQQFVATLLLIAAALFAPAARAGIPVIDAANLIQSIEQVLNSVSQINNQIQQIRQLQAQIEAISGARNLGQVLNNPLLQNYVPREAVTVARGIEANGYQGLTGTAKALRDARMIYNCANLEGAERTRCQSQLAAPYQSKAWIEGAMERAAGRSDQINALMAQINLTTDQKGILELQGRLQAENALLQHESTQIALARDLAEAELRVTEARSREAQLEQQSRTGRLGDFLRARQP